MNVDVNASMFVPIFPVDLTCTNKEKQESQWYCQESERSGFVLQGQLQQSRSAYLLLSLIASRVIVTVDSP